MLDRTSNNPFRVEAFLATEGPGRRTFELQAKGIAYSQGGPADSVFYLRAGRVQLSVVSTQGKEATVALLAAGDFFGEETFARADTLRTSTATAVTPCVLLRIEQGEGLKVLREEHDFADFLVKFILLKSARMQADLIDQLFNSSEKRLARALLLMADFTQPDSPETSIAPITQEALAEMIGTTRSRVSFFMNRFRKLGYIDYNGCIHVHKSLRDVVMHDQLL